MKLNRKLVLILSLVLSVALATGGTLAYLSDTDADVNVMTLGNVQIVQNEQQRNKWTGELEEFSTWNSLYPAVYEGDEIAPANPDAWIVPEDPAWEIVASNPLVVDKFVTVSNTGKSDAYIRTLIAYEGNETYGPEGDYIHVVHNSTNVTPALSVEYVGIVTIDDVDYTVYSYTYPEALAAGAVSIPSLKQVYMDKTATNAVVEQYGEEYEILVLSQAVQTAGFDAPAIALDAAFGEVNEENVAKWMSRTNPESQMQIGSPGDKAPTNDPPTIVSNADELADALANAQPGDKIKMEPGDYGAITLGENMDNVTIFGEGATVTKLVIPENMEYYSTVINGLTFENGNNNLVELNGAPTVGGGCLVFNECTFKGPGTKGGRGISVNVAGARVGLTNCTFDGVSYPVYGNCELSASYCTFKNSASWVFHAYNKLSYVEFWGCSFENVGGIAKDLSVLEGEFYFMGNTLTGSCGHDGLDSKIFDITLSPYTNSMMENNTKDGAAWTPNASVGLKQQ